MSQQASRPDRTAPRVALGIMCKPPRAGHSKTRLAASIGAAAACDLAAAFLADTGATASRLTREAPVAAFGFYVPDENARDAPNEVSRESHEARARGAAPADAGASAPCGADARTEVAALLPSLPLIAQRGHDLGERMRNALADMLAMASHASASTLNAASPDHAASAAPGFAGAFVIGSDCPTLPVAILRQAVEALLADGDKLVIGPAHDGGYFLIGLNRVHNALFEGIAWSTPTVLDDTLRIARSIALPVVELPTWRDVDDAADLDALRRELAQLSEAAMADCRFVAAHTRAALLRRASRDET